MIIHCQCLRCKDEYLLVYDRLSDKIPCKCMACGAKEVKKRVANSLTTVSMLLLTFDTMDNLHAT